MKAATVSKLRLDGQDFAVMPWGEYQRLKGKHVRGVKPSMHLAEDAGDAAEVKRLSGEPNKSYADLRRKLKLA